MHEGTPVACAACIASVPALRSALRREPDGSQRSDRRYQRLRRELLGAERDAASSFAARVISDGVMHRVLRDIALEDVRLDFER